MATSSAAHELSALVDTLLPGDSRFPSASSVGTHGLLAGRLRVVLGGDGLSRVLVALEQAGGPLHTATYRAAVVARLEEQQSELFASVRMASYLSYYQNPIVIEAVRSLGRVYNDAPQPNGYALPPFDPQDRWQAPTHQRGAFVATESVKPVDLAPLPEDPTAPEDWSQR